MRCTIAPSGYAGILLTILCLGFGERPAAGQTVVFSTGFEVPEGYEPGFTLVGQDGWVDFGSGGNGILTNFFEGEGQQAFIGFNSPTNTNDVFSVWKPINFEPLTNDLPVVTFSVLIQIDPSSSTNHDDFRWSVYNSGGIRFFSLDFDGVTKTVNYGLDDGMGFFSTLTAFDKSQPYELVINMNFKRNLWSATLNGLPAVNAKPITTVGSVLNLGDVDAVWVIRNPDAPGNNYMFFDNYRIVAAPVSSIPSTLQIVSRLPNGATILQLFGEPGLNYTIDASSDLVSWTAMKVVNATDGVADFVDNTAANFPLRFYRARQTP
ncbi:MAG: hypothetical protein ABI651_08755 [Verrucomicrobiota bacterium]